MTHHPLRRSLTAILAVGAFVVLGAAEARAQVPPLPSEVPFPTEEPTEDPVPEPDPAPTGEPEPSPTPSDEPTGGSSPTPEPDPDVADQPTEGEDPSGQPSDAPSGGQGSLPGFEVFTPEAGQGGEQPPGQAPQVAPGRSTDGTITVTDPDGTVRVVSAGVSPLAAALPGTYGIGLLAALLGVATLFGTFSLTQRGLLLATDAHGGTDVDTTRRWRTTAGVALLAAAALVGIIGYVKISVETLVPVQVVYMASAGFGVIVLAAAGGAMLISEQLRSDEKRLTEIESALATIAGHLAPAVSDAPRLLDRSATAAATDVVEEDEDDATDEVAPKTRASAKRPATKKAAAKKTPAKKRTAAKK